MSEERVGQLGGPLQASRRVDTWRVNQFMGGRCVARASWGIAPRGAPQST